jgi:ribosomal protein S18 acetylase RimI-like enzyme
MAMIVGISHTLPSRQSRLNGGGGQECFCFSRKAEVSVREDRRGLWQAQAVEIVVAGPADGQALRDLHVATWAVTYRDRLPEAFYRDRLVAHRVRDWVEVVRRQCSRGGGVLTARCDRQIVGFCQYGPTEDADDDPERVGHIHRLYVEQARQRAGVGRSLLATSLGRLREQGASGATLWVLEADARAQAFYRALGWIPDGARREDQSITDLRYRIGLG